MKKRIKHSKQVNRKQTSSTLIIICSISHCIKVAARSIVSCEANPGGTIITLVKKEQILSCENLGHWEKELPDYFWRIHDHWIINSRKSHDINISEHKLEVYGTWYDIAKRRFSEILKKFKDSGIR
jgi:DNA-binding LytR/AlgR family response regulator